MYGSFHEPRFDALGLTLRIDSMINVLFEELAAHTDLYLITRATFARILTLFELFSKALAVDGIKSSQMEIQLAFLRYSIKIRECSFTQYLDIFRGFSNAVRDMINDNFNSIHAANFMEIGSVIKEEQILKRFLSHTNFNDKEQFTRRAAEIFFRDCGASSLGLQQLDILLNRILGTLYRQSEELSRKNLNKLLNYDPKNAVARIDESISMGSNIIYLGNKGLNLIKMNCQEELNKKPIRRDLINKIYQDSADRSSDGYLLYTGEQNVSTDIIGMPRAAAIIEGHETHTRTGAITINLEHIRGLDREIIEQIKDQVTSIQVTQAVIYGWYDNEMGSYVNMLGDRTVSVAESF